MESKAKRVKYDDRVTMINYKDINNNNEDLVDFLNQFDKETATLNYNNNGDVVVEQPTLITVEQEEASSSSSSSRHDISQTLHHLEEGITSIRTSLEKPKSKRVNLNELNRKIDLILEILTSWCIQSQQASH